MADKDIDFEELDRAVSALMEKQAAEEDTIEALAQTDSSDTDKLSDDEIAAIDENLDIKDIKPSEILAQDIDNLPEIEEKEPDFSQAKVKINNRVPIGMEESPGRGLSEKNKTPPTKAEIDQAEAKIKQYLSRPDKKPEITVGSITKSIESAAKSAADSTPVPDEPPTKVTKSALKDASEVDEVPVKITPKKKPVVRSRGKYMDFVTKPVASTNRPARSSSVIRPKAKHRPFIAKQSVDFKLKMPAQSGQPATAVRGNYQTDKTITKTDTGDTMTVTKESLEYVAKPEVSLVEKPKTKLEDKPADLSKEPSEKSAKKEKPLDNKSPFIPEAKVPPKRPLGQPEPMVQVPSVTMHVPDRISTYNTGEKAALYRAELRPKEVEKESSKLWILVLVLILAIVGGLVYYFWGDLKEFLL